MWFFLSLFFALATAVGISISKHVLKTTDVLVYTSFTVLMGVSAMGVFMLFRPLATVDMIFFLMVAIAATLNVVSNILFFYAIKIIPVSLLAPLTSFHPVFAALFGYLFLSEHVGGLRLIGVCLIVIGAYLLQVMDIKKDMLAPFRSLLQQRGVVFTLAANMLWGATPVLEKTAIAHTSSGDGLITTFTEGALLAVFLFPLMLLRAKNPFGQFKRHMWWYILPAPFAALAAWSAFTAISLSNIGIVSAVFKLSVLFTILLGAIFFKEERIGERFLGAAVMLVGTVLLVI